MMKPALLFGRTPGHRAQRGSALLIVLALMSVLVLLLATLAFNSRIELLASRNFEKGVQNQLARLTGVQYAQRSLALRVPEGPLSSVDLLEVLEPQAAGRAADSPTNYRAGVRSSTSDIRVRDASARININAADEETLERLFTAVARESGVSVDASGLAKAVVSWRLGPDGAPGAADLDDDESAAKALLKGNDKDLKFTDPWYRTRTADEQEALRTAFSGTDDPAEYVADIRHNPNGDDRRFRTWADLATAGASVEFASAAKPYVTTFSISRERAPLDDYSVDQLDLNRASAEEILAQLRAAYGATKDETLLRQFAANVVDARDSDSRPTVLGTGADRVLGFENLPVITEVYADSRTEDSRGDEGQFVEIHNPHSETFSVEGWSLNVGGTDVTLTGSILAGGYLIVTDNIKTMAENPEDRIEGLGSFYDVFGTVGDEGSRRILQRTGLSISHSAGSHTVELKGSGGTLADVFPYTVRGDGSTLSSYQRRNPIVRAVTFDRATPFAQPSGNRLDAAVTARLRKTPANQPFTSVLELFGVFAGYADRDTAVLKFPTIERDAAEDVLDVALLDLFTVELAPRLGTAELETARRAGTTLPKGTSATASLGLRSGLVNINTASAIALEAVGLSASAAAETVARREAHDTAAISSGTASEPLFTTLSEVLTDRTLFPATDSPETRARAFEPLLARLTVGSRAFLLESVARPEASSGGEATTKAATAIVALDRTEPAMVNWVSVP